jgi:hypothetical protein
MPPAALILSVMIVMFIATSLQNWLIISYLRDVQKSLSFNDLNIRLGFDKAIRQQEKDNK